jgi:exodeoxyribonuclease V alpha subunit
MSTPAPVPSSNSSNLPAVSLTGVVERITFHAEETGYTVARMQVPRCHDLVTTKSAPPPTGTEL